MSLEFLKKFFILKVKFAVSFDGGKSGSLIQPLSKRILLQFFLSRFTAVPM